jgi:hypothetical protein
MTPRINNTSARNPRNISIARRQAVATLGEFVRPKR